jgi:hypothetical protein
LYVSPTNAVQSPDDVRKGTAAPPHQQDVILLEGLAPVILVNLGPQPTFWLQKTSPNLIPKL